MLQFESFVFTCLTYRNVQCFRNWPVHESYGLKASQMSKVRASSQEYPHPGTHMFKNEESSGTEFPQRYGGPQLSRQKELTSRQKEKTYGKNNKLTAKIITTTSRQKK